MFELYLPWAGLEVNPFGVISIGLLVGFLAGLVGVGGGFLMVPLLNSIFRIPMNVAAGTDLVGIVATATSGTAAHYKLGHVEWKLGLTILIGSIPGGWTGVYLLNSLKTMGASNLTLYTKIVWMVILSFLGSLLFLEGWMSYRASKQKPKTKDDEVSTGVSRFIRSLPLPPKLVLEKAEVSVPAIFAVGLGFLVGILSGFMGVGGGFLMTPALVYGLGLPVVIAVGTDLFQMVFTATNASLMQAISGNVDLYLLVIMFIGTTIGAQIGAKATKYIKGPRLRMIFGGIVLIVAMKMIVDVAQLMRVVPLAIAASIGLGLLVAVLVVSGGVLIFALVTIFKPKKMRK
ncbi:MAG: sulfite exporter TauE/SafE family protein [Euryarchaeota archaeon]|nr:sulfite exporter TauE/SafE family protein [Euryarchaeota archaeon]